jgi:hypothetical protein
MAFGTVVLSLFDGLFGAIFTAKAGNPVNTEAATRARGADSQSFLTCIYDLHL